MSHCHSLLQTRIRLAQCSNRQDLHTRHPFHSRYWPNPRISPGRANPFKQQPCRAASEADVDRKFIRQALELAKRGLGKTEPNPAVGCVIVKDGQVVGEGYHPKAGMPHAEVYALRGAGHSAEGATAYVTLEPCNHYGRTPPCSQALVAAKVSRVVVGVADPNPLVGGQGICTLEKAGIQVAKVGGEEEQECYAINEAFMKGMEDSS